LAHRLTPVMRGGVFENGERNIGRGPTPNA
jgi:hypothetical protein